MATVIRKFLAVFGVKADTDQLKGYSKAVDDTADATKKAIDETKDFTSTLASAATAISAMAVAGVGSLVAGLNESFVSVNRWSQAFGVGVDKIQELQFAAESAGLELDDIADIVNVVGERAFDSLNDPASESAQLFKKLGINVKGANGEIKPSLELLDNLADGMAGVENPTEKAAIASILFGDVGVKMLPILNRGSAGLAEMGQEARDLGLVMGDDAFNAAGDFNAQMIQTKGAVKALAQNIAVQFLPGITRVSEAFTDWFKQGQNAEKTARLLTKTAKGLAVVLAALVTAKMIIGWIGFVKSIRTAVVAMRALKLASLKANASILLIPLLIAAIALAVQDLMVFLRGGDSLIGRFVDKFKETDGPLGALARGIDNAKPALQALISELMLMVPIIMEIGKEVFDVIKKEIMPLIIELVDIARDLFTELGPEILALFKTMAAAVSRLFKQALPIVKQFAGVVIRLLISASQGFMRIWLQINTAIIRGLAAIMPVIVGILRFVIGAFQAFAPVIEEVISGLITFVEMAFNELGPIIMSLFETLEPIITGVIDGLKLAFEEILPVVISVFTGIISVVVAVVGFFVGVKDSFLAFWTGLVSFFGGIAKGVLMVWQAVIGAVIKIFAPLFSVVQKAIDVANKLGAGINVNLNKSLKGVEKKLTGAGNIDSTIAGAQATAAAGAPQSQTNNTSVGQVQVNVQGNPNQGLSASDLGAAAKAGVLEATQMREAEREFASG